MHAFLAHTPHWDAWKRAPVKGNSNRVLTGGNRPKTVSCTAPTEAGHP